MENYVFCLTLVKIHNYSENCHFNILNLFLKCFYQNSFSVILDPTAGFSCYDWGHVPRENFSTEFNSTLFVIRLFLGSHFKSNFDSSIKLPDWTIYHNHLSYLTSSKRHELKTYVIFSLNHKKTIKMWHWFFYIENNTKTIRYILYSLKLEPSVHSWLIYLLSFYSLGAPGRRLRYKTLKYKFNN